MKCPWCSMPIERLADKCGACSHEFDAYFRSRLAEALALRRRLAEIVEMTNHAAEIARSLQKDISSFEERSQQDAREFEAMDTELSDTQPARPEPPRAATARKPAMDVMPMESLVSDDKGKPDERKTPKPRKAESGSSIETALGQKWLPIIGVVTVIFGVGYFLKYAIDQGWVSPLQRVMAAYAWGAAFIGAGHLLRKRGYEAYGLIIMGGGLAAWYFSTFAAYQLYGLIGQSTAFTLMFLITLASGALSVIYSNMWLSVLGLFGGYLTPIMLSTGSNNYVFLFIYLAILCAGVLGVAYYRRWPALHYLGFLGTYTLFFMWYVRHFDKTPLWPPLAAISAHFLAFSIVPFAYRFFRADEPEDSVTARSDIALIIVNSFLAFGLTHEMITSRFPDEYASIAAFLYAAVFAAMSLLTTYGIAGRPKAFSVFAANAGLFACLGFALLFSEHWITFFWAVQAAAFFWAALRMDERGLLRFAALVLMIVACIKMLTHDYMAEFEFALSPWHFRHGYAHALVPRAVVVIGLLGSLYAMIWRMQRYVKRGAAGGASQHADDLNIRNFLVALFIGLLLLTMTAETSGLFHDYLPKARFASISVLWTAFSAALMVLGFRRSAPVLRKLSFGLFSATLFKVFFIDISKIDTPYRILSFIVLGTVLVCVSYLYHRFHDRLAEALGATEDSGGEGRV